MPIQTRPIQGFMILIKAASLLALLLTLESLTGNAGSAQHVSVGKANYRTDLPAKPDGKPRRLMKAKPLVSERVVQPSSFDHRFA